MSTPAPHRILIVDDEPDVHAITKLSLRGMTYKGRGVELATASNGKQALDAMRARPDTAVMLLDVVMETPSSGLDACRSIRNDLGNRYVRILLRTGQPGSAPERKTIEEYDIDGYLPKAELSSNRLFAAVRTALKAHDELLELERHRHVLSLLHDSTLLLRAFEPLESALQQILSTAAALCPAPLTVLELQTFENEGTPRRCLLHLATDPNAGETQAEALASQLASNPAALSKGGPIEGGFVLPLVLHRNLGRGWIYVGNPGDDALTRQALDLLATHAANALYAIVAQSLLQKNQVSFIDSLTV